MKTGRISLRKVIKVKFFSQQKCMAKYRSCIFKILELCV